MAFTSSTLLQSLRRYPDFNTYLIGFSGGVDSTVLLHAMHQLQESLSANILAVHIHHGLQSQADTWLNHCRGICQDLSLQFLAMHVDARPHNGESPEAAARVARYAAIETLLDKHTCLLTGHHQEDQAETLLLQLLRGSGPTGLASMPGIRPRGNGWHVRPLLEQSRSSLCSYAEAHRLRWIDDPSNLELAADRNFLRHRILPQLRARWPAADKTISRAAHIQADAKRLLNDLAAIDYASSGGSRPGTLSVSALINFADDRRNNLLRYWIGLHGLGLPTSRQIATLTSDILQARWDSMAYLCWPGAEIRRYRNDLYAMKPLPAHDASSVFDWNIETPLDLPHLESALEITDLISAGLVLDSDIKTVQVRFRLGGEKCRRSKSQHHLDVKKLLQYAGVPPWERNRIPLIYFQNRLLAVVGYWVCV